MLRSVMKAMKAWKEAPDRKPLILRGARQVGKTWLMKEFARQEYQDMVYCNFDEDESLGDLFERTKAPGRLLEQLGLINGLKIKPGKTLIILDEVQECPAALNSLKYFHEQSNEYHVVAAGSLLGTYLAEPKSYPVGQVNLLNVYPLTFHEFLQAAEPTLTTLYESLHPHEEIPTAFHERLLEAWRTYLIVGGMPECVSSWAEHRDAGRVEAIQKELLSVYENDITKHNKQINAGRILLVYRSIVPQLTKENEKFSYRMVKAGARAREFEEAIEWLVSAGILHRIYNVSRPGYPLSAYAMMSNFKLFFFDTGLLKAMAGIENAAIVMDKAFPFRGALTENALLQQFIGELAVPPYYYAPDVTHEIDFLLQHQMEIIPLEAKTGKTKKAASFRWYIDKFDPQLAFRYSERNYRKDGKFTNMPVYLAGRTDFLA